MGFIYQDITGKDQNSGQYRVSDSKTGVSVGQVIDQNGTWYAQQPGSSIYINKTFESKQDAAKYLSELAGIDWRKK